MDAARGGARGPAGRRGPGRSVRPMGRRPHVQEHDASVQLGRLLPPGTLVHGKLANGSVTRKPHPAGLRGRGFGNYEDRKTRDDVRYILTYVAPSVGYERGHRSFRTFSTRILTSASS